MATFYDHFDCVKDGEEPPAPVTVRVCDGLSCQLGGAEALLKELADLNGKDVRIKRAPCIGACDKAPAAALGQHLIPNADRAVIDEVLKSGPPTPEAMLSMADMTFSAASSMVR